LARLQNEMMKQAEERNITVSRNKTKETISQPGGMLKNRNMTIQSPDTGNSMFDKSFSKSPDKIKEGMNTVIIEST